MNGKARPAKFEPPPTQPITTSGNAPAISICCERLLADDRLVQQDVVEHAAERVRGVVAGRGVLDGLRDGDAQAARRIRICLEDRAAGLGVLGRARQRLAPQVCIIERRYGFWWYEILTM